MHTDIGVLWRKRFGKADAGFHESIEHLLALEFPQTDLIHHFPLFTGHVNLARYLALYESYKLVADKAGHVADVGTWLGSSFVYMAKLIRLFEPHASTCVHAFDWFEGMGQGAAELEKNYRGSYEALAKLVDIQGLSDVAVIHKMDLRSELPAFGADPEFSQIRFKYVFMDCGMKDVLAAAVPFFWERLLPGGVMLFDHFSTRVPHETEIVIDALPAGTEFRSFPFTRQPTAYVIK